MSPEYTSLISTPAVLLAQKIEQPVPPGIPTGPTFATRPDYYGKSTYTFDVKVDTTGGREPFSLVFYRSDENAILEALYETSTIEKIREDLAKLDPNDFTVDRFSNLANMELEEGAFKLYDNYRFPEPDKTGLLTGSEPIIEKRQKLREAVNKVFVPLTKNPPIYEFIRLGRQTEGIAPKLYDNSGNLLPQDHDDFHPFPMCRKFPDAGKKYVRFTDYSLDGSAANMYFYFSREISSQLKMSERSPISGPIMLVNSFAAERPSIKTVFSIPENPAQGKSAMVIFDIEPYLESENITGIKIFRTIDAEKATSVRNMTLVRKCTLKEIYDNFDDLDFPPYGEVIYYRLVAERTIINEQGNEEMIPSQSSEVFMTNVIDVNNPMPPVLNFTFNSIDANKNLDGVSLSWEPTCYNGTYHLYKQGKKGNWSKFYTVKSNNTMVFLLAGDLAKLDENGKEKYHRFKLAVENASGMLNITEEELTI